VDFLAQFKVPMRLLTGAKSLQTRARFLSP
jgi:hypothetical protein